MKHAVLQTIYDVFEEWASADSGLKIVCSKGCSSCCTQNVTITALEGEKILRFIIDEQKSEWLAEKLDNAKQHQRPSFTTNDFAKACLENREIQEDSSSAVNVCPFLEKNLCQIYPVRPFHCRIFVSNAICSHTQPAITEDYYLEASTAMLQVVEHLGQKEYWGNMLDVLPALLDISEFKPVAQHCRPDLSLQGKIRTLTAKPLPGFLISEEAEPHVTPLLEKLFSTTVESKRVEDILNGK